MDVREGVRGQEAGGCTFWDFSFKVALGETGSRKTSNSFGMIVFQSVFDCLCNSRLIVYGRLSVMLFEDEGGRGGQGRLGLCSCAKSLQPMFSG
jgi:hypothetical protein